MDNTPVKEDKKWLIAGALLVVLGIGWLVYEWNPGFAIRAETKEERSDRLAEEQNQRNIARQEALHRPVHP